MEDVGKSDKRSRNRIVGKGQAKVVRPSKCRSKNGMNLAKTIEIEKLMKQSPEEKSGAISFQSLINAKNSIRKQNKEYVDFIREIEELSSENEESRKVEKEKEKEEAKDYETKKNKISG